MRISASAINDTQECELKGFWKYVEKRKGSVESPYGVFGSCLHASIADIIKSNAIGDNEFIKINWTENFYNSFVKKSPTFNKDPQEFLKDGEHMLISWSNDMIKRGWTNANVLFLEEYFKIKVSGDMTMSGFIDLVFELDGETYLVDWKSNYKISTKEEVNNSNQLSMYYFASTYQDIDIDKIGFYFLRYNKFVETARGISDMSKLFDISIETKNRLKKNNLNASYSEKNCKFCEHKKECMAFQTKSHMVFDKNKKLFIG